MKSEWILLTTCFIVGYQEGYTTETPIIGIVTLELYSDSEMSHAYPAYSSYFPASYAKAVESSGARVVPIISGRNESYYRELLYSINGVVFPGGTTISKPGHPYYDSVSYIYKIAKEINDKGTTFPILGVCLGFEYLLIAANANQNFLEQCDVNNEYCALKFQQPKKKTKLYSRLATHQYHVLKYQQITINHHTWCALVDDFKKQTFLNDWTITSTSAGRNEIEFVASVEHSKYPFFGVQFHPEKVAFEWLGKTYPHSEEAVLANRHFYDTLVYYARMNKHKFADAENEYYSLIYSGSVVDARMTTGYFVQIYAF